MTTQLPYAFQQLVELLMGKASENAASLIEIRPITTFRFNPLKHTVEFQKNLLKNQNFSFYELEGLPTAARLDGKKPHLGKSFSHFAGHLYIQDFASMLPVIVLDPKPGESVLDMCAAPGSKTTQIAAAMKNQGLIVANDTSVKRLRSLVFNLRRMGVTNTAVCKGFGEQYGNQYFETFNRVLVDAPCSALGTLYKSPEVLSWWTPGRTEKLAGVQFRLVESGLKALKPGGVLIYSTCTITPEENEQVLDRILKQFPVEIEPIRLPGVNTRPGLTHFRNQHYGSELSRAIRLYPTDNQSEGFFVARLRKLESFGTKNERKFSLTDEQFLRDRDESIKPHLDSLADRFGIEPSTFSGAGYSLHNNLSYTSSSLVDFPLPGFFVKAGLPIAHIRNREALLTTEGAHLFGHLATRRIVPVDLDLLECYANRETLPSPLGNLPQVLVCYKGAAMGHAVSDGGKLLSRFPRTGSRFEFPVR